jgi:hypothetical protein
MLPSSLSPRSVLLQSLSPLLLQLQLLPLSLPPPSPLLLSS